MIIILCIIVIVISFLCISQTYFGGLDLNVSDKQKQLANRIVQRIQICNPNTKRAKEHLILLIACECKTLDETIERLIMYFNIKDVSEFFYQTQMTDVDIISDAKPEKYTMAFHLSPEIRLQIRDEFKNVYKELNMSPNMTDNELNSLIDVKRIVWTKLYKIKDKKTKKLVSHIDLLNYRVNFYLYIKQSDGEKIREIKRLREELKKILPKIQLIDAQRLAEKLFMASHNFVTPAKAREITPDNLLVAEAVSNRDVNKLMSENNVPNYIIEKASINPSTMNMKVKDFIPKYISGKVEMLPEDIVAKDKPKHIRSKIDMVRGDYTKKIMIAPKSNIKNILEDDLLLDAFGIELPKDLNIVDSNAQIRIVEHLDPNLGFEQNIELIKGVDLGNRKEEQRKLYGYLKQNGYDEKKDKELYDLVKDAIKDTEEELYSYQPDKIEEVIDRYIKDNNIDEVAAQDIRQTYNDICDIEGPTYYADVKKFLNNLNVMEEIEDKFQPNEIIVWDEYGKKIGYTKYENDYTPHTLDIPDSPGITPSLLSDIDNVNMTQSLAINFGLPF